MYITSYIAKEFYINLYVVSRAWDKNATIYVNDREDMPALNTVIDINNKYA